MTVETLLLAATTLIALVAVVVAIRAVRAVRELKHALPPAPDGRASLHVSHTAGTNAEIFVPAEPATVARPAELAPRAVEGRVIVPPTQSQVVRTALGRPGVRLSVLVHGLARALRPENRDRLVGLMRREYRYRRRARLRAGRQAVRMARPTPAPSTERSGGHAAFLETKPLGVPPAATLDSRSGGGLTERMINS